MLMLEPQQCTKPLTILEMALRMIDKYQQQAAHFQRNDLLSFIITT